MALNRQSIIDCQDNIPEEIDIPEWGGSVYIRSLTAAQRDRWEAIFAKDPHQDLRARLAVFMVCDDAGNLLFTEADIPALSSKNGNALDRIVLAAKRLNKVRPEDVEDQRKNS